MLVPLIAVALAATSAPPGIDNQCGKSDTIKMSPADTLDLADSFRASLVPADRARLDAALPRTADDGIAQCAGKDGAQCDMMAYVGAFNATGLMPRFLATICPKP